MSDALGQRVVRALSAARTVTDARQGVLREVARWLDSPLAILWLVDEETRMLRWGDDWSDRVELSDFRDVCRRLTFAEGAGLPGAVLATLEPGFIEDIGAEDRFPRAQPALRAGVRAAVAVPLVTPEGPLGVLEVLTFERRPQAPEGLKSLETVARQLSAYLARVQVEEQLRAAEETSASIFRAALDCVITMDHAGRIVEFNPAAEATFGYDRDAVIGDMLAERIIPPDLREAHRQSLAAFVEKGEPTILNRRLELTGMRADGSTFPAELTVARLGSGEPPTFVGFIRDITDRRQAEDEHDRLLTEAVSSRARAQAAEQRAWAAQAAAERAHAETEAAGRRLALLAQASERMLAIRDYEDATQELVRLALPTLGDWCSVTLSDGGVLTTAAAHRDASKARLVQELVERLEPAPPVQAVIRSGRTDAIDPVTDADLRRLAADDTDLRLLRELAPRALLNVPLKSPGRVVGAMTFAMAESGRSFEPDDIPLAQSLAARAALAIENARLLAERSHIAVTLQKGLLPPQLPAVPGLQLAARYRPAGEENLVGGDFYDFFRSGDGVWTAAVGDVTGKGPEAAAVTALTRHTLRAAALRASGPIDSLRLLNEALLAAKDGPADRFASVVYARICPRESGVVVTVSAGGHPPPLILRADGILEDVDVVGTVLGALTTIELAEVDVELSAGDTMLFYTDGVTEIRTEDAEYGERLLRRTLRDNADASVEEIVAAVERAAVGAQHGEPRDDIALIALRAIPADRG